MKRYTPEEAIGEHFSMLYPPEGQRRDEPLGHLRTAAIEGRFRGEGMRIRKGGDLYLADVSITPIYEAGEVIGFTKVVQDLPSTLARSLGKLHRRRHARPAFAVGDGANDRAVDQDRRTKQSRFGCVASTITCCCRYTTSARSSRSRNSNSCLNSSIARLEIELTRC